MALIVSLLRFERFQATAAPSPAGTGRLRLLGAHEAILGSSKELGDEVLVFSTDYPHSDSRFPQAVRTFLDLDISTRSKEKILWDNSARLYGIGSLLAVSAGNASYSIALIRGNRKFTLNVLPAPGKLRFRSPAAMPAF